jgi:ribosomal protein S18 acetylase RimI-like enzyme
MTDIVKAQMSDSVLLAEIGSISFIQSHGHSAAAADIENYVNEKFSEVAIQQELSQHENIFHIIYHEGQPAGYSKIIFNSPAPGINIDPVTKLERIYLLENFYDLHLGHTLLQFNIELSKQHEQKGIWLYVWKNNTRAVRFYEKHGFEIIGSHDFKLTATHSNPNHRMMLTLC